MNLFTTNVPLQKFNNEVILHLNSIEEKETKIVLALSDLLEEKDNHENFIKNSLNYLEVNYGLSRRVWLVLLKLHDKLPNFTDLLSTWKIEIIKNMEFNYWLNNRIPLGDLPFYLDHRKHSIQKLFFFIDSLAPHFKTDEICDLLSLFLVEFDTGKSPFSLKKLLKTNVPEAYKLQSLNYIFVSYSYSVHSSLKNLLDVFKPKDRSVYVRSLANRLYKVGISSLYPEETLENIKVVFAKYTSHPFLSYSGFVEIKEKEIDECDFDLISCLLESFEKSFLHSKFYHMFFINILKLLSSYGDNVENGIDKVLEIYDYGYMADDYILKAIEKPDYKLKDLLAWSNAWHMNGEHININVGEKVFFKDFNVGHSIEEYDFVQILNNHSLHAEGKTQKHCVFNYERKCIENDTIIVSMRNKKNNIVSTLRFQILKSGGFFKKSKFSVKLVENRKKFNAKCNEYETSIVNEYVKFVYKNIQLTL